MCSVAGLSVESDLSSQTRNLWRVSNVKPVHSPPLSHRNIAQIYGVKDRALVMESVTGVRRRLEDRSAGGRGRSPGSTDDLQTLTMDATQAGAILGAGPWRPSKRGKEWRQRAGIWVFGVVLYELLTACLPRSGDHHTAAGRALRRALSRTISAAASGAFDAAGPGPNLESRRQYRVCAPGGSAESPGRGRAVPDPRNHASAAEIISWGWRGRRGSNPRPPT